VPVWVRAGQAEAPRLTSMASHGLSSVPAADPLDMLTPERVSELLKVRTSTVYALCRDRRIPHLRVSRRIDFERAALMDRVRAHLVETA
jgi:excisionase family DNA binding protein